MGGFVKWIGGFAGCALGYWSGGIYGWGIGAVAGGLLGFIAGTVIDSFEIFSRKRDKKPTMGEFAINLLVLIAAVMKADGPVVKSELECVKQFLKQNFGEKDAVKALALLNNIRKLNNPPDQACNYVNSHLDQSSKLQLIHFLYNLANIDGNASDAEQKMLKKISNVLRVNLSEDRSVGRLDVREKELIMAYATLGVNRTDNIIEVKKAYRSLANKYHPDKVAFLDENQKKNANDHFQRLTSAYEIVKNDKRFT